MRREGRKGLGKDHASLWTHRRLGFEVVHALVMLTCLIPLLLLPAPKGVTVAYGRPLKMRLYTPHKHATFSTTNPDPACVVPRVVLHSIISRFLLQHLLLNTHGVRLQSP